MHLISRGLFDPAPAEISPAEDQPQAIDKPINDKQAKHLPCHFIIFKAAEGLSRCAVIHLHLYCEYRQVIQIRTATKMQLELSALPHRNARTSSGKCPLLELPAEIRNNIFELALAYDSYRKIQLWPPFMGYDQEQPSLALVNRQVRQETLPVFSNQASVCIFAYINDKWEQSKVWLMEQECFIREMKIIFTKYAGDILTIQGFVGHEPSYELTLHANTRRMGDYTYEEEDLRTFVESHIQTLMEKGQKNWFGIDEYAQFGDLFLREYYEF